MPALQVEYCLTGEGWDEDASAISLRGLDAAVYYRSPLCLRLRLFLPLQ